MAPLQISAATAGHKFSTISSHVRVERNGGVAVEFATDSLAVFTDVAEKTTGLLGIEFGENGRHMKPCFCW